MEPAAKAVLRRAKLEDQVLPQSKIKGVPYRHKEAQKSPLIPALGGSLWLQGQPGLHKTKQTTTNNNNKIRHAAENRTKYPNISSRQAFIGEKMSSEHTIRRHQSQITRNNSWKWLKDLSSRGRKRKVVASSKSVWAKQQDCLKINKQIINKVLFFFYDNHVFLHYLNKKMCK